MFNCFSRFWQRTAAAAAAAIEDDSWVPSIMRPTVITLQPVSSNHSYNLRPRKEINYDESHDCHDESHDCHDESHDESDCLDE